MFSRLLWACTAICEKRERERERVHGACTLLFFWLGFAQFVFRGQKSVWMEVRRSVIYDYALGNSGNGNICIHRDPVAVNLRGGKTALDYFILSLASVCFLSAGRDSKPL